MNTKRFAARVLRGVGLLLFALGLVHLAATPHIPGLLIGCPVSVYQRAVGPTLLNHVLVGLLLLPLGYSTWLAAAAREHGEAWATRILIANTMAVFTLPLSLVIFMRRPEYYTAPLFLMGVALVAILSLLMIAAISVLVRARRSSSLTTDAPGSSIRPVS